MFPVVLFLTPLVNVGWVKVSCKVFEVCFCAFYFIAFILNWSVILWAFINFRLLKHVPLLRAPIWRKVWIGIATWKHPGWKIIWKPAKMTPTNHGTSHGGPVQRLFTHTVWICLFCVLLKLKHSIYCLENKVIDLPFYRPRRQMNKRSGNLLKSGRLVSSIFMKFFITGFEEKQHWSDFCQTRSPHRTMKFYTDFHGVTQPLTSGKDTQLWQEPKVALIVYNVLLLQKMWNTLSRKVESLATFPASHTNSYNVFKFFFASFQFIVGKNSMIIHFFRP